MLVAVFKSKNQLSRKKNLKLAFIHIHHQIMMLKIIIKKIWLLHKEKAFILLNLINLLPLKLP